LIEIKLSKALPKLDSEDLLSRKEVIGLKKACNFKLKDFLTSIDKRLQLVLLETLDESIQ